MPRLSRIATESRPGRAAPPWAFAKMRKRIPTGRNVAGRSQAKNKSPALPGFLVFAFDRLISRVRYFASFAIWCASRETFRLAVFL